MATDFVQTPAGDAALTTPIDHAAVVAKMVDERVFSRQLLAWAEDPNQQGTLPNEALMAGVLVELCHRMNALE